MAIAIYGAAVGDGFSYSSIFCIVYAGALGLLNVTHFRQAGYLYTPFSWLMCVGPMITVWFCLASQFQQHSSSNEFVGIVLAVLGIPLSIFLWLHLHEGQLNRLMFSSYKNLSSSDDLLIYNY